MADGSLITDQPGSATLRIGAVISHTEAEGPGTRFAVWAQGCSIRCNECFNPHLWGPHGGRTISPDGLARQAIEAAKDHPAIEGVTLLGGEPFEQAAAFAVFASAVRARGLSIMIFSGYEREHLESPDAPPDSAALLAETDLLIDGPYRAEAPDLARPWVGSTNQRFHFLTDRYDVLREELGRTRDRIEVRVAASGEVRVNGWATLEQLDELLSGIRPQFRRDDFH